MSTDSNEETTASNHSVSGSNEEWNQQTLIDARNILQPQMSNASWQYFQEQQSGKINKESIYPTYVLHPEVIPSLNDVPKELNKRRNVYCNDSLVLETLEAEMPMDIASSLQDELERAVQNRTVHDRNNDQEPITKLSVDLENAFQAIRTPECIASTNQINIPSEYNQQVSFLTRSLSHDTTSLREAFQRIKISGESEMPYIEDLDDSVTPLLRALIIREKYMFFSLQSYPPTVANFLSKTLKEEENQSRRESLSVNQQNIGEPYQRHPPDIKREEALKIPLLPRIDICVKAEKGIYCAYILNEEKEWITTDYPSIDRNDFIEDYILLSKMVTDGPLKSFCYRRLQYLKAKFELHCLLNEVKEWAEIRLIPHRDFYNVRKVDTHIHAASSMTQKHLLRFMKKKLKTSGEMQVYKRRDGKIITLQEVFDELKITTYDLSVDLLGVHAIRQEGICSIVIVYLAFKAYRWLSEDQENFIDLLSYETLEDDHTLYRIKIVTSSNNDSGTDSSVFMKIYGENDRTQRFQLITTDQDPKSLFKQGQTDQFEIKLNNVGNIKKINIAQDGKGLHPVWHLKTAQIQKGSEIYKFNADKILDLSMLDVDLIPIPRVKPQPPKPVKQETPPSTIPKDIAIETLYKVMLRYGSLQEAPIDGDSNLYVIVAGVNGQTKKIPLLVNKKGVAEFKTNDVGKILKIYLGHDESKHQVVWHIDDIIIKRGNETTTFYIGRSIEENTEIELTPSLLQKPSGKHNNNYTK
ncbi:unnamed protein product [Rotaria sp. Silwood1]|nr:unnamed protein product [Rotaria sp. Silwood1]